MIITELRTSTWFRHPFSSSSQSLGTHGLHAFGDWGTYVFVFIYTGPQNSQFASFFFHFKLSLKLVLAKAVCLLEPGPLPTALQSQACTLA